MVSEEHSRKGQALEKAWRCGRLRCVLWSSEEFPWLYLELWQKMGWNWGASVSLALSQQSCPPLPKFRVLVCFMDNGICATTWPTSKQDHLDHQGSVNSAETKKKPWRRPVTALKWEMTNVLAPRGLNWQCVWGLTVKGWCVLPVACQNCTF